MAIGLEMDGHRTRDEWPFGCNTDGHRTPDGWPSDYRPSAQLYAPASLFHSADDAIRTNTKGQISYIFTPFMQNLGRILHKYAQLCPLYAFTKLTKCKLDAGALI